MTASELTAVFGWSRATAFRAVAEARRLGTAIRKPVTIGNGATRLAWAIPVVTP
jgi:hypothetical protein